MTRVRRALLPLVAATLFAFAPLAFAAPPSGQTTQTPQEQAKQILDGREYRGTDPPRPFRKPLQRLGDWIENAIDDITFGSSPLGWGVLALLAALLVAAIVALVSRNRVRATARDGSRGDPARSEDPAELERQADRAEQAGDHSTAVRLRYRAGLLRLGQGRAIAYRPSLTAHQVSQQLESQRYDELASRFENVAYGEREASPEDSALAASEWREVIREARK